MTVQGTLPKDIDIVACFIETFLKEKKDKLIIQMETLNWISARGKSCLGYGNRGISTFMYWVEVEEQAKQTKKQQPDRSEKNLRKPVLLQEPYNRKER